MKQENLTPATEIVGGIEVITDRIRRLAEEERDAILAKAKAEADEILLSYQKKADACLAAAKDKAAKESKVASERAISASSNHKRNLLLFEKGALVEKAFDRALGAIESMDTAAYTAFLSKLLENTLEEYLAGEQATKDFEGDLYIPQNELVLTMSERDAALGKALIEAARPLLAREGKTLCLGKVDAQLSSGFAVVAGDIRIDCSPKTLIALQKATLEAEVFSILFA